ncbi:MAG: hypothetical protein V1837_04305 [Candidatus Woesearchaeota archaeon]
MGSTKDLVTTGKLGEQWYAPPTAVKFGYGPMQVKGTFSVADLKKLIPESIIKNKAEALAMQQAAFAEYLQYNHPEIPNSYYGILDKDFKRTDVQHLLSKGETSSIVVMKLAHTPDSFCEGNLDKYRAALQSGELQCGVADVESIFRLGFPLGSSTFEDIFKAVRLGEKYEHLATYNETAAELDKIRAMVSEQGLDIFEGLEELLQKKGLGTTIPNPGFVLKHFVYDTTTKFVSYGDLKISEEDAEKLSGLSHESYQLWKNDMFPKIAAAQIKFCMERNIFNIDGKSEIVAYHRMPVVADFQCTVDENREMIVVAVDGVEWLIPSNKEIQRAIFRKEGVYAAKAEALRRSVKDKGVFDHWKEYFPAVIKERKIDLVGVTEFSCDLMANAIMEVANRTLGHRVFDAKPLDSWVRDFVPYASKLQRQGD